ncbi:super-infection exclusion protein B [Enterocloster clostridioformis]
MKDFIDFLKLPPNILGALSIASGTLLLLPQKLAQKFYIINFREKYGFTIGIVFVISTALLVLYPASY